MQANFWSEFAKRADAIESVMLESDGPAFFQLTNELADCLLAIEPRLNLNIGGPDPFHLAIIPLPGAERVAESFVGNGTPPDNWGAFCRNTYF